MALDFEKLSWWSIFTLTRLEYKNEKGEIYSASHLFTSVSAGSSVDVQFKTGSKIAHCYNLVRSTGQVKIDCYAETDIESDGTEKTPHSRNGTSDNEPNSSFYYSPSINSIGTNVDTDFIPGGSSASGSESGGAANIRAKHILKPSSDNVMRITNKTDSTDLDIFFKSLFYEELNG